MDYFKQINDLRVERARLVNEADKVIGKALSEKRAMNAEEEQTFDRLHTDAAEKRKQIEQIEKQAQVRTEIGATVDTRTAGRHDILPDRPANAKPIDPKVRERYESLEFRHSLSNVGGVMASMYGSNIMPENLVRELNELRATYGPLTSGQMFDTTGLSDAEKRALSATTNPSVIATGTTGSSTVPQGFIQKLEVALKYYGGILDAAEYIDTDNGAPLPYPTIDDTANLGELTAENGAVGGSDINGVSSAAAEVDPTYGVASFAAYMIDSGFVRVPIQLMQDSAFNVDDYLIEQLRTRIGRKLTAYCTTGTGNSQPQGVVTGATLGVTTGVGYTTTLAYNDLLGLYHSVDPSYRDGAKVGWMMSDTALLGVRKLVDSNNRPLFITGGTAEGIVNGAPERLLGKPYWVNQAIAVPAASAKSILFGDFSKFKIRRVRQLAIAKVDQLFVANLQIGFLAFQRYDSRLVDAGTHPIKYLQHGAS